jgi:COMPASS component SPP1
MLALHSADGTISNFDDARVNLGASQSKRNGKSQLQQQQLAPTPPLPEEEEQEIDDRLYCIVSLAESSKASHVEYEANAFASLQCQDLYDPERIMIACDRCDEWYHIACIGLSEEIVDLVGRFICPACEAGKSQQPVTRCCLENADDTCRSSATGEKTTYRAPCARKECTKAVMKHSKYCSDWCGLTVAASRLELQQDQIDPVKLWKAVEGFQRQEAFVTVLLPDGSVPVENVKSSAYNTAQELDSLSTSLDQLVARRMSVEAQHSVVNYRLRYLRLALQRWQHSCAAFKETNPVQPTKKSKSKSGASASAADGPCGFDVRLVWDDKDFADWVGSEGGRRVFAVSDNQEEETQAEVFAVETVTEQEEGLVCGLSRKKCDRHTGWQKMREADYEGRYPACCVL